MGHTLGMYHDFVDGIKPYTNCRRHTDSTHKPCNQCHNYDGTTPITEVTGHAEDCCNGFMGYGNTPKVWSDCSVRFFRQHYVSLNWSQCMDSS